MQGNIIDFLSYRNRKNNQMTEPPMGSVSLELEKAISQLIDRLRGVAAEASPEKD